MQTEGKEVALDDVVKAEVEAPSKEQADDLPDKYRGKSVSEIVRMHQEAEKLVGRQAAEVGELRRLADDFIKANLPKVTDQEEDPDFFVDPKKAVRKAIESDSLLKEVTEKQRQIEARLNMEALEKAHPDYSQVATSQEFQEWVGASKYRQQLFATADKNWDFDAANELFSTWKALNKAAQTSAKEERGAAVKRASVPSGGTAGEAPESGGKKIYRRADIIRLYQTDPKRYEALQGEIMRAYSEGRVR